MLHIINYMVTLCDDEMTRLHAALALTPLPAANACFFLDVDGTLLDFAATPDGVHVDDELIELLAAAARSVQGALALVSGRSLESLDRVLAPLQLPAAGVHGFERRDARGIVHRQTLEENRLESARAVLEQFVARHPGLLLEDKRAALALHFRQVPNLEELVQVELARTLPGLRPDFELLEGEAVLEIKPAGLSKATAVEAF
ncbi:MAG TPA: trehalose-phosphatase, partial [Steroidobacteraceae bacterium]